MQNYKSLLLSIFLGLVAGIGHGITSHHQELPFSLTQQVVSSLQVKQSVFE